MNEFVAIDAHVHLWEKQQGLVNGRRVYGVGNGRADFGGSIRQMMPPYMTDNANTIERLIANMDYACVNGCVVTQEYIDGNQNAYLKRVREQYPDRVRVCALYEDEAFRTGPVTVEHGAKQESAEPVSAECTGAGQANAGQTGTNQAHADHTGTERKCDYEGFDGVKICAGRLADKDLRNHLEVFKQAERLGLFISIDMADGDEQVESLQEVINACPDLRIAIGHFGMVTTKGWQKQIELACNKNVFIESGGLTWLFHKEFYPYPSAVDAIVEAKNICGMEKLMWGSDYPRTMTDITYIMALRFIKETEKLTKEEKRMFLGANAQKFYGFPKFEPALESLNML